MKVQVSQPETALVLRATVTRTIYIRNISLPPVLLLLLERRVLGTPRVAQFATTSRDDIRKVSSRGKLASIHSRIRLHRKGGGNDDECVSSSRVSSGTNFIGNGLCNKLKWSRSRIYRLNKMCFVDSFSFAFEVKSNFDVKTI